MGEVNHARVVQRAFGMLHSIHKDLDYAETTLSYLLGGPICVAGCGGKCCHQSMTVVEISAQYIAANIKALAPERQQAIVGRLEKWLLYPMPAVRLNFSEDGEGEKELRQAEYEATARLWCPFLSEDAHCLIYPWRDVTCRAWGVTRPMGNCCTRPVYEGETEELRSFIGSDIPMVQELCYQTAALKGLLKDHLPQTLRKGWLPTLVYRILLPKEWEEIKGRVQETKMAGYHGLDLMWILTKEDTDKHVKDIHVRENSIKVC